MRQNLLQLWRKQSTHYLNICFSFGVWGEKIVVLMLGKWKVLHGPLKFLNESKYLSA